MDSDQLVNVNKVGKNLLSIGQFGLFQVEHLNLIATQWFMLSVNEEQFWKIRCKVEARKVDCWLVKNKEGLRECMGTSAEELYELYCRIAYSNARELQDTLLSYRGIKLFADPARYYGLQVQHLDMVDYIGTVKNTPGSESVVINNMHVFTTVSKENIDWTYFRPLGEGVLQ